MSWSTSNRSAQLPPNWREIREAVKARAGGRCERIVNGIRCPHLGRECDHARDRNDHRPDACEWLCTPCHRDKTQAEAAAGRRAVWAKARRPRPVHPGLR